MSIFQEMETKLTKYLTNKSLSGTIGDEFMHFLLWGKPRYLFYKFLIHLLTIILV